MPVAAQRISILAQITFLRFVFQHPIKIINVTKTLCYEIARTRFVIPLIRKDIRDYRVPFALAATKPTLLANN